MTNGSNALHSWSIGTILGIVAVVLWIGAFAGYFYGVYRLERHVLDFLEWLHLKRR